MVRKAAALIAGMALLVMAGTAIAQNAPKRSITKVAGDVYRFQNNFHFGLFVVTGEGVVVSDTINEDTMTWLKAELAGMTDQPVTHLIYSHSHLDHASGGSVLAEGATVIAHANAPEAIDGVRPDIRFTEVMHLTVGSKTFEMTYLGEGHGTDLIATVVRPENVAFIVDAAAPKRLPFRDMPRSDIDGWIDQVRVVESLDFEIFAPGHGMVGSKEDATHARVYMETLRAHVLAGLKAGKDVDTLVGEVTLDDYKDWSQYDSWREPNIRGMARHLEAVGAAN